MIELAWPWVFDCFTNTTKKAPIAAQRCNRSKRSLTTTNSRIKAMKSPRNSIAC